MVLVHKVHRARQARGRYLAHGHQLASSKVVGLGQDGGRRNPTKLRRAFVTLAVTGVAALVRRGAGGIIARVDDGTAGVGQVG